VEKQWPLFSIIIASRNGKDWIKNCLGSVLASDYPNLEVIFVDDASDDGSPELVKKKFPYKNIKVIQNKKNLGWSGTNNQGIPYAKGEYLVFLSNDMEVKENWLKQLLKTFEIDPKIGVVQCFSVSMKDKKTVDSPRNYLDRFGFLYSYQPSKKPAEVFFAEGMAFAVRKRLVDQKILLDDYFTMEYDDADYGWRARLAGWKVYFAPEAIVYHARGGTVGGNYFSRQIANLRQYSRNQLVTLIKNYEIKNMLLALPVAFLLHFGKGVFLLVRGYPRLCLAVWQGLSQVFLDLPIILEKRRLIQKKRKVSDKELMKTMVPFRPSFMVSYITLQAKGLRPVFQEEPKFLS